MRLLFILCALIASSSLVAQTAAAPPALEPIPDGPPELTAGETQVAAPEVTIRQLGDQGSVEEYRVGGMLYMIKINPTKGRAYYLVDSDGDGRLETRYNDLQDGLLIPAWVLLRW